MTPSARAHDPENLTPANPAAPARLVVSRQARIVSRHDDLFVLDRRGVAHQLSGDSAELARSLLAFVAVARTRDEILAHLELLAGAPIEETGVIDETLALLQSCGAIETAATTHAPAPLRGRLLLAVSGAVAAAGSPELVARLQHAGFEVRVAMTRAARRFVSPLVLEAITHQRVHHDLWTRDDASPVPHINLAEWAELVLVCPASATTIARLAAGDCSELVAAIVTATRAPIVIVPSMNASMQANPRVRRNLGQLAADGCHVVHGGLGEELAHAPNDRSPSAGAAPLHSVVVDVACFVAANRPPLDWNALYAASTATPPFCAERFDPDFGEALAARRLSSGRALDVGCGTGTLAIELARRGFTVSAIDAAPRAIELARAREGAEAVAWIGGDALTAELGVFDVVIDRGFLHGLDRAQQQAWAAAMARATAPGGWLLVKTFSPAARLPPSTRAFAPEQLAELMSRDFTIDASWPSVFHGHEAPALFAVFRRV